MQETLGILLYAPWIYVLVALCTLLDVFVPVLPSGALVVTAATFAAGAAADVAGLSAAPGQIPEVFFLVLVAATASFLGDLAAYRLARRGGRHFGDAIARSRRLAAAHHRIGAALSKGGGALVVLARFAPAGRALVSLGAGATHRRAREFLPWSAVAAVVWTGYSVGVGYVGGQLLGASWLSTGLSVLTLFAAGCVAARALRSSRASEPPSATPAPQ